MLVALTFALGASVGRMKQLYSYATPVGVFLQKKSLELAMRLNELKVNLRSAGRSVPRGNARLRERGGSVHWYDDKTDALSIHRRQVVARRYVTQQIYWR